MAKEKKVTAKSVKNKPNTIEVPGLLGLAFLLALLCILPWVSTQSGSDSSRALQVSLVLLALTGGVFLGLQIASHKKK